MSHEPQGTGSHARAAGRLRTSRRHVVTGLVQLATDPRQGVTDPRQAVTDPRQDVTDLRQSITDLRQGMTDLRHGITDLRQGMTDLRHGITDPRCRVTDLRQLVTDPWRRAADPMQQSGLGCGPTHPERRWTDRNERRCATKGGVPCRQERDATKVPVASLLPERPGRDEPSTRK